jgi:hypothetical protein
MKVTLKDVRRLVRQDGQEATLIFNTKEVSRKNYSKRPMGGGFVTEYSFEYNGKIFGTFKTIREAKQLFGELDIEENEESIHDIMMNIVKIVEEHDRKQYGKKKDEMCFFSKDIDDVLGLNVFK